MVNLASFNDEKLMIFEKEGNLGSGIMRRFNLTFDYANKRMFIKPNKSFYDPFEFNMAGIQYSKSRVGHVIIDKIIPDSPGSEAGLELNDEIIPINNIEVSKINRNDLKTIFEKENTKVTITFKRQAITNTVSVKLRRII